MKEISAQIIADSINPYGNRITTMLLTFPRFILAELNTHRIFSRNSASSRAIPFNKMVKMVQEDPFIPVAWQKEHTGMQGTEYHTDPRDIEFLTYHWKEAGQQAVKNAEFMSGRDCTKQLCNRLLEPFMWHTVLVTSTEWDNFFHLRSSIYDFNKKRYKSRKDVQAAMKELEEKGVIKYDLSQASILDWLKMNKGMAEIHMMLLAEAMWDAYNGSTPKKLIAEEWHIPFYENIDLDSPRGITDEADPTTIRQLLQAKFPSFGLSEEIKIATARAARTSYLNFDGKDDYEADLDIYGSLLIRPYTNRKGIVFTEDDPIHASPAEHCARTMTLDEYTEFTHTIPKYDKSGKVVGCDVEEGWCLNFRGFIQLRYFI